MKLIARLTTLAAVVIILGYAGYLAIVLGPHLALLEWSDFERGYERILWPAQVRGPLLRTAAGGADRIYVLTTQQERIVPLRLGRVSAIQAREMLHVDLWAFDAATARPAWRRRLRTYEDHSPLFYKIFGADGSTLWLFVRQPIAVSLRDGAILADGARLEALNPALAGKRVDDEGFVALGAQGLQLTLSDSMQWAIDGETFAATPRASAPMRPERITMPAYDSPYTSRFQLRGIALGAMWLGVLTDTEAAILQAPPVVPGARPGDEPGVMADFLATQHYPQRLEVAPVPYRLWSAKVKKVSAAPRDWPKDFPDRWGTRDQYSDYKPLPDSPPFLQAGLLGNGSSEQALWAKGPDSVFVLHHDKVGSGGRVQLARVAGPGGRVVWDAPLLLAHVDASMLTDSVAAFFGRTPNPGYDRDSETSPENFDMLISVDVASGRVASFDLTSESLADTVPGVAVESSR